MADTAPPVEVRGLVKRYGELEAVAGVDLTVHAGDVYGYLGPNGAGKTTCLRMMLGLIRPTAGTVRLWGRDPLQTVQALDGVAGFVEAPTFYPYLSGRRNLELLAAFDGGDAADRIEMALETVELTDRARDKIGGYSHGMRQRIGIAAALLRDPKLLLLDEPATGLDPAGMRDMRLLIRRLADQGMTVLLSSHLLAEVEELCNRVAIVRKGKIVYEGAIADLKRGAGATYRLSSTDDERALAVCRAQPGIGGSPYGARADLVRGRRVGGRRAIAGADRGRRVDHVARAAIGHARGFVLLADRGRRRGRRVRRGESARGDRGGVAVSSGVGTADSPGLRSGALAGRSRSRPGVAVVYRWELFKLRYQKRTYLGLGAAAIVPILFVVAIHFRHHRDNGNNFAFQSYLTKSGLVVPLVLLLFGAVWLFPLITALVAGDIFASEDHNGTLKTVLTRSLERWQIFTGKALAAATYAVVAIFISGTVGVVAGSIQSGFNSVQTLSGSIVSAPKGLELVYLSLLVYLIPIATVVCIGLLLSTITRNSAAAVVGTLMISLLFQLIGVLPGLGALGPYLLSTQFNAWQGLLRQPIDWSPIVRAAWVCAMYGVPALATAFLVFLRRDVAGG